MKKFLILIVSLIGVNSNAEIVSHTGTVKELVAKDSTMQGQNTSYVEINGFDTAGSCKKGSFFVRAIIRDNDSGNRMYSMLLGAVMANKDVKIQVDDGFKNSEDYCYIRNVRFVL